MPPNRFESEVESFLEGSHGDRTHIKRADHHTVTPLCGTLLHRHPYFARNLSRSFFETPQKRCNSNDANSMFEQAAGELRAKLMGGGGAWPGFKATRRAKLAARTASGRATAHGCIKQPGPRDRPRGGYRTFRVAGVSPRCCGRGWCGGVRSSKLRRPSRG